jgi:protein-disulfide isomerase
MTMTNLPARLLLDLRALAARPALLALLSVFAAAAAVAAVASFPGEASPLAARQSDAQPPTAEQRAQFQQFWEAQPRMTVPVASDGAAVLIIKFADLQCPPCSTLYFALRPVLAKYQAQNPGAVRYLVKDWPWQPECNPNVLRPMHSAACDAAAAVRLARQANKGDLLEEYLYSHQPAMNPAMVREAAQTIAGIRDFDLQAPRVIESIRTDIGLGHLLGVRSTPTLFINGVKLESPTALAVDLAIAYELRKAGLSK